MLRGAAPLLTPVDCRSLENCWKHFHFVPAAIWNSRIRKFSFEILNYWLYCVEQTASHTIETGAFPNLASLAVDVRCVFSAINWKWMENKTLLCFFFWAGPTRFIWKSKSKLWASLGSFHLGPNLFVITYSGPEVSLFFPTSVWFSMCTQCSTSKCFVCVRCFVLFVRLIEIDFFFALSFFGSRQRNLHRCI